MKPTLGFVLGAATLLSLSLAPAVMATESSYNTAAFPFATHITMGLPEQDVFVRHDGAPADQVFKISPDDAKNNAVLDQPVYATNALHAHDPFGLGANPLGPFAVGKPLGFTMRQWLAAGGNATYGCDKGQSTVSGDLHDLVPNGQYTVWYSRLTFPPNFKVVDRPLGAPDGSQNAFKADANGNATFSVTFPSCLEDTSKETATLIVTAYHSDGQTYGPVPGNFGSVTHVQNIAVVPPPATPSEAPGMPTTGSSSTTWLWGMLATALLCLAAGGLLLRRAMAK
jgi:hypothetical protein